MATRLLSNLRAWLFPAPAPKATKLAVAIAFLKKNGSITAWQIQDICRTTDARKMISDMRRMGLIRETVKVRNASGIGTHALHYYNRAAGQPDKGWLW